MKVKFVFHKTHYHYEKIYEDLKDIFKIRKFKFFNENVSDEDELYIYADKYKEALKYKLSGDEDLYFNECVFNDYNVSKYIDHNRYNPEFVKAIEDLIKKDSGYGEYYRVSEIDIKKDDIYKIERYMNGMEAIIFLKGCKEWIKFDDMY